MSRPPSSPPASMDFLRESLASSSMKREGLVFLDSSAALGGASVVAEDPAEVLRGNLFRDAEPLRACLRRHQQLRRPGAKGPSGGLFGWVAYDGEYVFGVYPACRVYEQEAALQLPDGGGFQRDTSPAPWKACGRLSFMPQLDKQTFCGLVERAQRYIAAGDIYQVNLSYPWVAEWPSNLEPWSFYEQLRRVSPAPFGAFLDLDGVQIMSASPECFLKMSGGRVLTRPIKGTRPRGVTMQGDLDFELELLGSPKERAELVMITDLERNDLGQVCAFGSVRVTELLKLKRYAQVHHLTSTVEGVLKPEVDHLAALLACFPGGSITGAPKKRAMEVIDELEPHPRGLYTGAIGYLGFNGESQFSIAIRTAVRRGGVVSFHTGAGIVADSVPDKEWDETQHKARGLLKAAGALE